MLLPDGPKLYQASAIATTAVATTNALASAFMSNVPPRVRQNPVLSSRSDGQEDGVDGLGRRAIGARLEPFGRGAQELAVVAHAGSSPWSGWMARASSNATRSARVA